MLRDSQKRLLILVCWIIATGISVAEIPTQILIKARQEGISLERVELTGGPEAFLLSHEDLFPGTVRAIDEKLHFFIQGEGGEKNFNLVLSPIDEEWEDGEGNRWLPRERVLKKEPSWTPVHIRVRDQKGLALEKFGYNYRIEWKEGGWDPLLVRSLKVEGETLEILAPPECAISLELDHPDLVRGYGSGIDLDRKGNAKRLDAVATRGKTVSGKVIDDATGKPIKDAVVCPNIFMPPLFVPDLERAVVTGADGAFTIRGVDGIISARHPNFLEEEVYFTDDKEADEPQLLRLRAGTTIRGVVRDLDGKALPDVTVDDGSGKVTTTNDKGEFVLRGLQKWSGENWWLDFAKEGFDELSFRGKEIAPEGLKISLVPLPEFRGRVMLPDGNPARKFFIVCGPGANPADFECVKMTVTDERGAFKIKPESLPEKGTEFWIGIRAEGAAPWDGAVSMDQLTNGDFLIKLTQGAALSATLDLPPGATGKVAVIMEASDRQNDEEFMDVDHAGRSLASYELTLERGALLRIPHLRAGTYSLKIRCPGTTPVVESVVIGKENLELGNLKIPGTGSIFGVVHGIYESDQPWRFADGDINVEGFGEGPFGSYLKFKSDAEGRFRVDGVPVGIVSVSFLYHESADILNAVSRNVRVIEAQETEVRFEGTEGSWKQPLKLLFDGKDKAPLINPKRIVGNVTDREPMLRFDISPVGNARASWVSSARGPFDESHRYTIPDLSPGRWKIRVYDWLGSTGFDEGFRAEVIADVGEKRDPIVINLGAHSLSGRVVSQRETRRHVRIVAVGTTSKKVFLSRCDGAGHFVVRYLPMDTYLVQAHDDDGGWCNLGIFKSDQDCGEHQLMEGGHVTGMLDHGKKIKESEDWLRAISTEGLEIPVDEIDENGSFRFGNLRPGKWSIVLSQNDHKAAQGEVLVQKGKTVKVSLVKVKAKK